MSQTISLRLPDELANRLDRFARLLGNGMTRTRASVLLLDEALREEEFAGIEFRNTFIGRQPFVKGTGMAVWECVMVARGFDMDTERTADYLQCPVAQVKAALNYYHAFQEEIDQALKDNDMDEERLKRMFPNLRVFTFPKQDEAQFTEEDALKEMRKILKGTNSGCFALAQQVVTFFGPAFTLIYDPKAECSTFGMNRHTCKIKLATNSNQVQCALVHELLHGKLVCLGFPKPDPDITDNIHVFVNNLITHELMLPMYLDLGFEGETFTVNREVTTSEKVDEWLKRPRSCNLSFWCLRWYADRLNVMETENPAYTQWLGEPLQRVASKVKGIRQAIEDMEGWLKRREFEDPNTYTDAYDQLMGYMGEEPIYYADWLYGLDCKPSA